METLKKMFKNNIRQYGMIIALVVIMIFSKSLREGCCWSRSTSRT